jgi:hypothetical protein
MTRHVYPDNAMLADYLRAAVGFVPTATILATVRVGVVAGAILAGIAALFLLFGIRTALRHRTVIESSDAAVRASGPFAASLAWAEIDGLKLAYYSPRRDRRDGWLQLDLRAGRSVLRADSRIDGFAALVERAAWAAEARGLPLDAATRANLRALAGSLPADPPLIREARGGAA